MTITIEPKEIAELVELLARRDSAKEIMQTIEDNLDVLADKVAGRFARDIRGSFFRAVENLKSEFLADEVPLAEPNGNAAIKLQSA